MRHCVTLNYARQMAREDAVRTGERHAIYALNTPEGRYCWGKWDGKDTSELLEVVCSIPTREE